MILDEDGVKPQAHNEPIPSDFIHPIDKAFYVQCSRVCQHRHMNDSNVIQSANGPIVHTNTIDDHDEQWHSELYTRIESNVIDLYRR